MREVENINKKGKFLMKYLIIIFLIFSFTSCSILDSEDEYIRSSWASVEDVEVVNKNNGQIDFNILLSIPTPCNEFDRREVTQSGDTIFVKYFSKIKKETACIQVIGSMEINNSFQLEENKSYVFKFWQLGETYLDTLIFVE